MTTSRSIDQVQRFSFDETDLCGAITSLDQAFAEIKNRHDYPQWILQPLGELMAGVAILGTHIKSPGQLTLQICLSNGPVKMLQAEIDNKGSIRAIARYDMLALEKTDFSLNEGQMIITIEPERGQKYQAITAIEGAHVAVALEGYFRQSEQLESRFWLHCDGRKAAGMMLQKLPYSGIADFEAWERLITIGSKLKAHELYELSFDEIFNHLFYKELLRVYPTTNIEFRCTCSKPRIAAALKQLGSDEVNSIVAEQGSVKIQCEFCLQKYQFDQTDVDELFRNESVH